MTSAFPLIPAIAQSASLRSLIVPNLFTSQAYFTGFRSGSRVEDNYSDSSSGLHRKR